MSPKLVPSHTFSIGVSHAYDRGVASILASILNWFCGLLPHKATWALPSIASWRGVKQERERTRQCMVHEGDL